jgi:hypothetical protein
VAAVNQTQSAMAGWLTVNGRWLGLASGVVVLAVLAARALTGRNGSETDHAIVERVDNEAPRRPGGRPPPPAQP